MYDTESFDNSEVTQYYTIVWYPVYSLYDIQIRIHSKGNLYTHTIKG